jgi:hypothetical protein
MWQGCNRSAVCVVRLPMSCAYPFPTCTFFLSFSFLTPCQVGNPADYLLDLATGTGSWGPPSAMPANR